MRDGMFIFDNVVHMYDNTESNVVKENGGEHVAGNLAGFAEVLSNDKYPYDPKQLPIARLEDGTMWNW